MTKPALNPHKINIKFSYTTKFSILNYKNSFKHLYKNNKFKQNPTNQNKINKIISKKPKSHTKFTQNTKK